MAESILRIKSFAFAVRIVKLARYLREKRKEFVYMLRPVIDKKVNSEKRIVNNNFIVKLEA